VANPFLAVLGLVGWYQVMRAVLQARRLDLFFPALGSLVLVGFLFQFHCLDCGATGRLWRWRSHSCAGVQWRRTLGRRRRLQGPSPTTQTALWLTAIGVGTVFVLIRLT
jgi:hypothetical protein